MQGLSYCHRAIGVVMALVVMAIVLGWGGGIVCLAQSGEGEKENAKGKDLLLGDIFDRGLPGVDVTRVSRKWLDVPYAGRSPAQRCDIFLPEGVAGPVPVVIAIHGGSFYRGDKRDFQIVPMMGALTRGYAVVSLNYRLSGEATFPSQIHDVKAAIRFVRANAAQYGLDPDRIALWGDSAGANLAALAGTSAMVTSLDDQTLGNAGVPVTVRAVVDWYGVIDLLTVADQLRKVNVSKDGSPARRLIGKSKEEAPELYKAESPATYVTKDVPPFLIQHGDADTLVSVQQSVDFAVRLRQVAGEDRVTLDILPGAGHLDPAFNTRENVARVLDFLDAHMR